MSGRSWGGPPESRPEIYKERSPLFQVDKLQIPLLVHVARNDMDVNIEEDLPLIEALHVQKADLVVTKVYDHPLGGHTFDRRVNKVTLEPENTPEQLDSWKRVWRFFAQPLAVAAAD